MAEDQKFETESPIECSSKLELWLFWLKSKAKVLNSIKLDHQRRCDEFNC